LKPQSKIISWKWEGLDFLNGRKQLLAVSYWLLAFLPSAVAECFDLSKKLIPAFFIPSKIAGDHIHAGSANG
jgi:hypothetical protein